MAHLEKEDLLLFMESYKNQSKLFFTLSRQMEKTDRKIFELNGNVIKLIDGSKIESESIVKLIDGILSLQKSLIECKTAVRDDIGKHDRLSFMGRNSLKYMIYGSYVSSFTMVASLMGLSYLLLKN